MNISNNNHYNTVYQNIDPDFKDISINDFQLKSTSFAIDKGNTSIFIAKDLNDNDRPNPTSSIPELGAYEFY